MGAGLLARIDTDGSVRITTASIWALAGEPYVPPAAAHETAATRNNGAGYA